MERRDFFRKLMLRGLDRAEQVGRKIGQRVEQIEAHLEGKPKAEQPARPAPLPATAVIERYLRPPGALAEEKFVDTCTACGLCVQACPADAIAIHPQQAGGKPYIHASVSPCVMSLEVACTKACPSGALTVLASPMDIRMGVAKLDHARCLRTPTMTVARGAPLAAEECTVCVSQCPAGEAALAINDAGDLEVHPGCTGCGVCERACPTEPASIYVIPNWQATPAQA